jgi:general secretion pathway protein L
VIYLKSSVGIEIRKDDLIITCLRSNFSAGVFTRFRRISNYKNRDIEEVKRELDSFFKEEQVNRENIVLGIPGADVILRYLDFPKEVEENLKQVVFYQVQSLEPSEEERFYFDYAPVRSNGNGKKIHVLLAMIKKATLDAHLEVLGELGIRPTMVTFGSIALANMFLGTQRDVGKTYILADVQPDSVELLILRNGSLVYAHEAPPSAQLEGKALLLNELEVAVSKVRMDPEETIEGIFLAGEASEPLHQELRDELQDCDLMASRIRFEMPPKNRDSLQVAATSLGCAYSGLVRKPAMKLNLLPAELRLRQTRWAYVPAIILALLIAVLVTGLVSREMIQERIMIRELDEELSRLKSPVEKIQEIGSQAKALEEKIIFLEGLVHQRDMNLEILRELTEILPDDTYLTRYRNTDCRIEIVGLSPSAPDLLSKLEESPLLVDVEQKGTMFKDQRSGKDRFTLNLRCER